MKSTIYLVTIQDKKTGDIISERLVDTASKHKAEVHVIHETVTAERATTREVAKLMKDGVKVETPGGEGE